MTNDTLAPLDTTQPSRLYTRQFFQVFAAVMLFMTGVSLQFHFGQYFEFLGHDIKTLGTVAGISVTGALAIRLYIGRWIDRFGCRVTWLVGAAVFAAATLSIQFIQNLVLIVIARTFWTMSFATVMTAVAVFAAAVAPPRRRAESLGTIGLAGFTGMTIGPTLGDLIFSGDTTSITPYRIFFTLSAACAIGSAAIILSMGSMAGCGGSSSVTTDGTERKPRVSMARVLIHHWPGTILLVGVAFAMVFSMNQVFLERLAEARGFKDIKLFFLVYSPTAMALRVVFRRVPEQLGRTRTLVGGLLLQSSGIACMSGVETQVGLVLPGLLMGAGHCFIFPSMVDLAAERLPPEHRGLGTSVILGANDLGLLIAYLLLGSVFENYGFDTGLRLLAAIILSATIIFAVARRKALVHRQPHPPVHADTIGLR